MMDKELVYLVISNMFIATSFLCQNKTDKSISAVIGAMWLVGSIVKGFMQ